MTIKFSAVLLGASLMIGASAQAAVIGGLSNSVVLEDFENLENLGFITTGPVALAAGQVIATSNVIATYDSLPVDLGSNGAWGTDGYVGIGDYYNFSTTPSPTDSLTFTSLAGLSSLGADFSIYQDEFTTEDLLLEALSYDGSVLESTLVAIAFQDPASYNRSAFYGFARASNDIFGLRVTGDGFVIDNLSTAVVPEPGALPLLVSALGVFFGLRRKKSQ